MRDLGRAHWIEFADSLIDGYRELRIPDAPWNIAVPGQASSHGPRADQLEGFARLLLTISFRLQAPDLPRDQKFVESLLEDLRGAGAALRDGSENAWPTPEKDGQANVEAAAIAISLLIAQDQLWDPLDAATQDAICEWMRPALRRLPESNNWVLFAACVAAFLMRVGRGDRDCKRAVKHAYRETDGWYRGSGWYSDGAGNAIDYYNAWAFHFYLPLIAHFTDDAKRLETYRSRLAEFVPGLVAAIDPTGAPVYWGRSLTYRFALTAPLWIDQWLGGRTIDPGHCRLVASSVLDYFVESGAVVDGVLSVGWHGADAEVAQPYSCAASPLWAGKAFIGLLLPPDDPSWTATAEETARSSERIEIPGATIVHDPSAGVSRLHNRGISRWRRSAKDPEFAALYNRHAYSSLTKPVVDGGLADNSFVPLSNVPGIIPPRGEIDGLSAQTFILADDTREPITVYSLAIERFGIELRAFKATELESEDQFVATTWPRCDLVHCESLALIGFETTQTGGAFDRLVGDGEDGAFLLATRISRHPFERDLAEDAKLVEQTERSATIELAGIDRVTIEFKPRLRLVAV